MKIDLSRVQDDLAQVQDEKQALVQRLTILDEREVQLLSFLNMAELYSSPVKLAKITRAGRDYLVAKPTKEPKATSIRSKPTKEPKAKREPSGARFAPHRLGAVSIPDNYVPQNRRTLIAKVIAETFNANAVITAGNVVEKIGDTLSFPPTMRSPKHHVASVMAQERGPAAVLERVGDGRWKVRPDALSIVRGRIAAEIVAAQDEAARQAAS